MSPAAARPGEPTAVGGHLRNVLGALGVAVADMLTGDAEAHGLGPAEHAALIVVATLDGLSQEDLQRRVGLSQPGATRLVDRLAARGLVKRTPGPDRRTWALRLTPAGERQAREALTRRHELLAPLTARLTVDEQRQAAAVIGRLLDAVVAAGQSPWRICRQCDQEACAEGEFTCPVDAARRNLQPSGSATGGQPEPAEPA